MRILSLTALAASIMACGARGEAQFVDEVARMAHEVLPEVERAVGLEFKYDPALAVRTRDEVHRYLLKKIEADFPDEEIERIELTYRLFGVIDEDLDLKSLVLDLYTEQVAGYYDPTTDSLYVVEGADPTQLRLIVAHELVHALQAQYMPLDSIMNARGDNDRRVAAQAILEGQGILASLMALMPEQDFLSYPDFWGQYRQQVRAAQQSMPVFNSAPLFLREGLIFPYLGGADFVRWFYREFPGAVPFGEKMPTSTEQILHTEKYRMGDEPGELRFGTRDDIVYEDGLGEFETRVFLTVLTGNESTGAAAARDWGADRYAVFGVRDHHALVWWSVWDTPQASRRFATVLEREWAKRVKPGREYRVERETVGELPAVVFIDAPTGWAGLSGPPIVTVKGY